MRILLLNQFFWPDSAATSQLLTDVACELAARGHDVVAVCGDGTYAGAGSAAPPPNVEIRRTPTLKFARGGAARFLSYVSFLAAAFWTGLIAKKPDLVLTLTTPPLLSLVGTAMKLVRGSRHWIWEMDVYPDVAVELGWLKAGSVLHRLIGALADWSRRHADGILALGPCMQARLERRGISSASIHIAHNWADGRTIEPLPFPHEPQLEILYSGNLGLAHDIDTLISALPSLNGTGVARFAFNGGGPRRSAFESWCTAHGITGVSFRRYSSREELGVTLSRCDIGLVTQRPEAIGAVVPSKVYGLLAAGRPILYIGPRESTPHEIIRMFRCGWQVDCGDAQGLSDLLRTLNANRRLVYEAGRAARRAFLDHFDLPLGVSRIADMIGAAAPARPRPAAVEASKRAIF